MSIQECACCGVQWTSRKNTVYKDSESIPMIHDMSLISDKKGNHTRLLFCDLHGNNLRGCTRMVKGVLRILNKNTGKWRNAAKI